MRRYIINVATRDCPVELLERCFESIAAQNYENFDVVITEDATPGTAQREVIERWSNERGWTAIFNEEQRGVGHNHLAASQRMCRDDSDVVVFVDGDDRLINDNVLTYLTGAYGDETRTHVLMTYGSYISEPHSLTCHPASPYPQPCVRTRDYRRMTQWGLQYNHLRTISWRLLRELTFDDVRFPNGEWFLAGGDSAIVIPCLEMAGDRFRVIAEPLYVYTSNLDYAEWRTKGKISNRIHNELMSRPKKERVP